MRLVGLAVLALLSFALVALITDRTGEILTSFGLNDGVAPENIHVLETRNAPLPEKSSDTDSIVQLPIRQYDQWVALAGFSGAQDLVLPLPRKTDFSSAVVKLDIQTVLEENTVGRMKFEVNGQDRGEVILSSGDTDMIVEIPLEPIDMARGWVSVGVSAIGNTPKAACSSSWTGGVVVLVKPSSHIEVALTEPVVALEDKLIISGSPSRIVWQNEGDGNPAKRDISLPWNWSPFSMDAIFVDAATARDTDVNASLEELAQFLKARIEADELTAQLKGEPSASWPISIDQVFAGPKEREFRNKVSWEIDYEREDMPDLQLPDVFNLELSAVSSESEVAWLLVVTLNGQLVHTERLAPSEASVLRAIALPEDVQKLQNRLKVTLTSDEDKGDGCEQGSPAVAQLDRGTSFDRQGKETAPIFAGMLETASPELELFVSDTVSAQEANVGFYLLTRVFGGNQFQGIVKDLKSISPERGLVLLVDNSQLERSLDEYANDLSEIWVAFTIITDAPAPEIKVFKGSDPLLEKALTLYEPTSALIVTPPGFEM